MRITRVEIAKWRNLEGVEFDVFPEARIVCLVGENGSGKSTVLELLSFVAHHLGISSGFESSRGNPLSDPHDFSITALVPLNIREAVNEKFSSFLPVEGWNGLLEYRAVGEDGGAVVEQTTALGIDDPAISSQVAQTAISTFREQLGTQHLYLDADRAYPPMQIQPHQYNEILSHDWTSEAFTKQFSYRPTRTLYEEWHKYFIALEETVSGAHVAAIRESRATNSAAPEFVDPFDDYSGAVQEVLPHLRFVGVEGSGTFRTILFDSAGLKIPFSKLSGGEREIAFLIGQIDRFGLRQGLLMIDEPELHLNPDLLRTWVAYLRDSVQDGQVWLATHSLEAVEVAGPEASFVFEKDTADRVTRRVTALVGRPAVAALSAAIGAPAFSISKLRFVFVEGDRQSRERERFYDLCGEPNLNRFIEGGSCHEVLRRLAHVTELAAETGEQLKVGGVLDRDFRSAEEATLLGTSEGAYVLDCHEIENLFLYPLAIEAITARGGGGATRSGVEIVRNASDSFAGLWIAQCADSKLPELEMTPKGAMSELSGLARSALQPIWAARRDASASHFPSPDEKALWAQALDGAFIEFEERRSGQEWWTECFGKQTSKTVSQILGFANVSVFQANVLQLWNDGDVAAPPGLQNLRAYVDGLTN